MRRKLLSSVSLLSILFLSACSKFYVHIEREKIGHGYYASDIVGTPNPKGPAHGERLIISWKIPTYVLKNQPKLVLNIVYGNFTEETIVHPIQDLSDLYIYTLINQEYDQKQGIIAYKAQIETNDGQVFRTWTQQIWVDLIVPEKE